MPFRQRVLRKAASPRCFQQQLLEASSQNQDVPTTQAFGMTLALHVTARATS